MVLRKPLWVTPGEKAAAGVATLAGTADLIARCVTVDRVAAGITCRNEVDVKERPVPT
jgi:hypothetical protein